MNGSRSSGHCCVTDLGFLWLYAVRSQTVAAMAVKKMGRALTRYPIGVVLSSNE